jgi:hypothetical protein
MRFAERAANGGLTIVHIIDVYQVARTGAKAVVTIYGDPRPAALGSGGTVSRLARLSLSHSRRGTARTRTVTVSSSSATRHPDPECTTV